MYDSYIRMGKYLKIIRISLGLSLDSLANELGISRQTIIAWEKKTSPFGKMQYHAISHIAEFIIKDSSYAEEIRKILLMFVEGPYDVEKCEEYEMLLEEVHYFRGHGIEEAQRVYIETLKPAIETIKEEKETHKFNIIKLKENNFNKAFERFFDNTDDVAKYFSEAEVMSPIGFRPVCLVDMYKETTFISWYYLADDAEIDGYNVIPVSKLFETIAKLKRRRT